MGQSDRSPVGEPSVSVVIPAYNRAHLIGAAINSVLAQTYRDFELIVVDDASNDGLAALSTFADPRIHLLKHTENRGAAAARNTGIAASRGDYVAFLDSDDTWYPEKLSLQVAAMREQPPEVAGHVCAYDCVKAGYATRVIAPNWTAESFYRSQLFGCVCGPGSTLLCRRDVFADVGVFDEQLRRLEDWDWILRLAERGYRLLGEPRPLVRVNVGAGGARRQIDAALERIKARHEAAVVGQGTEAQRIFTASLDLERAAAAYGESAYLPAAIAILQSLLRYPRRGEGFYRRMAQRALRSAKSAIGLAGAPPS